MARLPSKLVEFDKVFVNGEPQYDTKDASGCRSDDTEAQMFVLDGEGSVKCGEVMLAQKGHFTFVCALCQMTFDSMPSFGLHVQVHMNLKLQRPPEVEDSVDDTLYSMMSPVPRSRPFDSVEIKQEGTDELETTLPESEIFECRDCSLSFDSKMLLLLHNKKDHLESITLQTLLEIPSQLKFPRSIDPQIPIATDSEAGEQSALQIPETNICKYCDKDFEDDETLSDHIRTHTGPLRFSCPHCPKRFRTNDEKLRHKASHSDLQPYACNLCPNKYGYPKALNNHMRKYHSSTKKGSVQEEVKAQSSMQDRNEEDTENPRTDMAEESSGVPMQEPHICKYCDKEFNDAKTLSEHIPTHKGPLKYMCPICPKKFRYRSNRVGHMANHTENRPYKCNLCPSEYCYASTLKRHLIQFHSKINTNPIEINEEIEAQESSQDGEVDNATVNSNITMTMEKEDEINSNISIPNKKIAEPTPNQPAESSAVLMPEQHICKYCDKHFNDSQALSIHIRFHRGSLRFSCPHCSKRFRTNDEKLRHKASHSDLRPFACDLCPRKYGYPAALKNHMRKYHFFAKKGKVEELKAQNSVQEEEEEEDTGNSSKDMPGPHICKYCDKEFNDAKTLSKHIPTHEGPMKYTCSYCPKTFGSSSHKAGHMANHTENRPYKCNLCPSEYCYASTLKRHVNQFHSKTNSNPIEINEEIEAQESSRDGEIDRVSVNSDLIMTIEKEEDRICEASEITQTQNVYLSTHRANDEVTTNSKQSDDLLAKQGPSDFEIANEKIEESARNQPTESSDVPRTESEPHICKYCDKQFNDTKALSLHIRFHRGPLRFSCPHCPKRFKTNEAKLMHKASHSDLRPFACDLCPKKFGYPRGLKDHMQRHLAARKKKENSRNGTANLSQGPYICKYCDKHFIDAKNLSEHIPTHEGPLKYMCPYCPKKLKGKRSKAGHMAQHTENRPFKCKLCPSKYCYSSTLKRHVSERHKKPRKRAIETNEEIATASVSSDVMRTIENEENQSNEAAEITHTQNSSLSTQKENDEVTTNAKHSGNSLTEQEFSDDDEIDTRNINSDIITNEEEANLKKPFVCDLCPKRFGYPRGPRKHKLRCHLSATTGQVGDLKALNSAHNNEKDTGNNSSDIAGKSDMAVPGAYICKYCDKSFNDTQTLSQHILTHQGPSRYSCPYCSKRFKDSTTKKGHMFTHMFLRPFKCQLCTSAYCYYESLKRHIRTSHSNRNRKTIENDNATNDANTDNENTDACVERRKETESETYTLAELFSKDKPAVKNCKFCDTEFENTEILIEHIKKEHKGTLKYSCPQCPKKFYTREIKLDHISADHGGHPNAFSCRLCPNIYCSRDTLRRHLKQSHYSMNRGKNSARTIAKKSDDQLDSSINAQTSSENANSDRANTNEKKEDPKSYTLLQLYAMHNLLPNIKTCNYCQVNFDDAASCMEHLRVCSRYPKLLPDNNAHESKPETSTGQNTKDDGKKTKEDVFEEEFQKLEYSHGDQQVDRESKPSKMPFKRKRPEKEEELIICPFCHYGYTSTWVFFTHLRKKHVDRIELPDVFNEKEYAKFITPNPEFAVCNYCDRKFEDISEFKAHRKTSHQGNLKYPCLHCPKVFSTKSRQRMHTNVHTGERPFKCPHCPKGFAHQNNLVKHIHTHLKIKKYECKFCGKRFVQSTERNMHEKLHTGQKDYQCEHCGSCFVSSSQLNVHIRRHLNHRNFQCDQCEKTFFTSSHLQRHMVVHTNERPFECDICHRTYPRARALQTHKQIHSTEKKYECNICGKKFQQYAGMYFHKRTHGERFK